MKKKLNNLEARSIVEEKDSKMNIVLGLFQFYHFYFIVLFNDIILS